MAGQVVIGGVDVRLVAAGLVHPAFQVIRDDGLGDAAKKGKGPDMGADPVLDLLAPGGLRVGVVARPQHGHEDLRLADRAGCRVNHLPGLAGVVHKELLTGAMLVPHHHVESRRPGPVVLTEPAVLVAVGVLLLVFLPQQVEGHAPP